MQPYQPAAPASLPWRKVYTGQVKPVSVPRRAKAGDLPAQNAQCREIGQKLWPQSRRTALTLPGCSHQPRESSSRPPQRGETEANGVHAWLRKSRSRVPRTPPSSPGHCAPPYPTPAAPSLQVFIRASGSSSQPGLHLNSLLAHCQELLWIRGRG